MSQTILHVFCVLFKIYCRLFGHTPILGIQVVQPLPVLKYKNNTSYHRVYTVRENQAKTYLFRDGQGKSGKIRESQGIQRKSQGKLGKSQGNFFGKLLPPMNQDPLFILAVVCQTSLTSYFSLYLDIFLL